MTGFRDRGAHRHSGNYVEHPDRVKDGQVVLLDRRSRVRVPGSGGGGFLAEGSPKGRIGMGRLPHLLRCAKG